MDNKTQLPINQTAIIHPFIVFDPIMKDNKICATLETKKNISDKYNYLHNYHAYSIYKLDGDMLHLINPHYDFIDENKTIIVNIFELREFTDSITYIYL